MKNVRDTIVSGNPLDSAQYSTSQDFLAVRTAEVGQRIRFSNGDEFVYVSSEVNLLPGQPVSYHTANAAVQSNLVTAVAAGATQVTVNTTGIAFFGGSAGVLALNRLAGGFLVIADDTGEGYRYPIRSHTAGTAAASVTFTLEVPLKVALDATSDVFLLGSPFDSVVLSTTALPVLGIAAVPFNGATNSRTEYGWIQTKGLAPCYITTGTSIAVGKPAAVDAGGVKLYGAVTDLLIGTFAGTATTATQKVPVWLNIT